MKIRRNFFYLVFYIILVACGTPPAPIPTSTDLPVLNPVSTATPFPPFMYIVRSPNETCASIAAYFKISVQNIIDFNNHLDPSCGFEYGQWLMIPYSNVSPPELPKFSLDGYIMVFVRDADLYFQDGNNSPVKLAHVGGNFYYDLSSDGQKVVYSRNDGNIYSINIDGSQEQIIITKAWQDALKAGTSIQIDYFDPVQNRVVFRTFLCDLKQYREPCISSLFLIDTGTGNIRKVLDLGLSHRMIGNNRNFEVSPNGKMMAVGTMEHIQILDMNGNILRKDFLKYMPSTSAVLFPSFFWLPDSSGLIVALPDTFYESTAYFNFPASTIWRYEIDDDLAVEIPLDPPPMDDTFDVSPDGNWIAYGALGHDQTVYLGSLVDGHIQVFGNAQQAHFSWAPNSEYFIVNSAGSYLGFVNNPPDLVGTCKLLDWIDANNYTCYLGEELGVTEISSGKAINYTLDIQRPVLIKPK
jgi:hypothetical protein